MIHLLVLAAQANGGAVEAAPLDLGFPEWLTFVLTVIIIILSYGIRSARGRAKARAQGTGAGTGFMHRADSPSASSSRGSEDLGEGVERKHD